jgi:hypothetical protein
MRTVRVYRTAEVEIGDVIARAEQTGSARFKVMGQLLFGVLFALLGLVGVIASVASAKESIAIAIMLGLLCLSFVAIGVLLAWDKVIALPWVGARRFELHERGIVARTSSGDVTLGFDEITALRFHKLRVVHRGRTTESNSYRFESEDGRKIWITPWVEGGERMGDAIVAAVTARQAAKALARIEAGETITLGPIEVSRAGMRKKNDRRDWSEVRVVVSDGDVLVRPALGFATRPWAKLNTMATKNALILVTLGETLARL